MKKNPAGLFLFLLSAWAFFVPAKALAAINASQTLVLQTVGTERARVVATGISVTGVVTATAFYGNGAGLTNLSGDNLGNHTATQNLGLGTNAIVFGNTVDDKIYLYSNTYGLGLENSTFTNWTASQFRWRVGGTSASTGTERMLLNGSNFVLSGGTFLISTSTGNIRLTSSATGGDTNYIQSGNNTGTSGVWQALAFGAYNSSLNDSYTKMLIDDSGNVGIGLIAPTTKLDVSGSATVRGNISLATGGFIYGDNADTSYTSGLSLYGTNSINTGAAINLFGKDHASYSGRAIYYGTTSYAGHSGSVNNIVHQFVARHTNGSVYSIPLTMYANGTITMPGPVTTGALGPDNINTSGLIATSNNISLVDGGSIYAASTTNDGAAITMWPSDHATAGGRIYFYSTNDNAASDYAYVFYTRTTAGTNSMVLDLRKNGAATFANVVNVGSNLTVNGQVFVPSMTSGRADNALCWASASGRVYQTSNAAGCTSESDIRLKTDIETFTPSLEKLLALRPVSFHWKDKEKGSELQLGFIAQEANKVIPEITVAPEGEHKYWGMRYNALIPYLVKGLQEAMAIVKGNTTEIVTLKAENATLKSDMAAMRKDLETLKAALAQKPRS